jgi:uroporphyrinogen decarboxylase
MTESERLLATLLGGSADRFPFFDLGPAEETEERWRREGLPAGTSVAEFFDLEPHFSVGVELRSHPFYGHAADLLSDPGAFERRYALDNPDRFPRGWVRRCRRLRSEGRVLYIDASGGGLFQMLGVGDWDSLVDACYAMKEHPARVGALLERTTDFYCECLERVLSEVTIDYASLYEPIAANAGPLVSPEMFREYSLPVYRRVIELLDRHEVPLKILCTTGGDLGLLLPMLIEAGINGLWISNIMSSRMEYSTLRREYGADIALIGGIDATALAKDDETVIRTIEETVPPLLESGRYLPCLDDRPRSNVPFDRYRLFRETLARLA